MILSCATGSQESESARAAGAGGGAGAARASESWLSELLAGGTETLREMLDTVRVPPDVVESGELSLPDLTRNDEDWKSHGEDEDWPDPGDLQN